MKYKTELHTHTCPVSCCSSVSPEEMVEKYVAAGYTTLVITNHINHETFDPRHKRYTGSEDWQERMDYYFADVARAKRAAGDRLHVLWGCELCPANTHTDYLIFGADEAFYRANADIRDCRIKEISARVRAAGALLYQAHPFRNNMMVTDPSLLFGVEVWNAHPKHDSRNDLAKLWAERYSLHRISGSDIHEAKHVPAGGILTDTPITTVEELLTVLRNDDYTLICEGTPGKSK